MSDIDPSSTKKGTGGQCPHCEVTRDCGKELQQHIESHNGRLSDFVTENDEQNAHSLDTGGESA